MPFLSTLLRTYAALFFSRHRGCGALLLAASFAHPWAGAAGVASAALGVAGARAGGFNRALTDLGAYSVNPLLVGLALGTLYAPGAGWAATVVVGAGLALALSVALGGWLAARGLPFLSLPFVAVLWLLGPGGGQLAPLHTGTAAAAWLTELSALGGTALADAARWLTDRPWPPALHLYLRALSGVLMQDSALAGLLVAAGLLWHSRIAFSLSVLGFVAATGLGTLTGQPVGPADSYNLGANYLLTVVTVGGVFLVPRPGSYALAVACVPVVAVLLSGVGAVLGQVGLPVYSLPFCLTALLVLYALLLREAPSRLLPLTPFQQYSPERNLYSFVSYAERAAEAVGAHLYLPLALPFRGAWRCSQAYADGGPTHQGAWAQALDFDITDADHRTYHGAGTALTDYHCFDKPVLAPADGVVEEVVSHLPDNAIGQVDTRHNWGNTVVLRVAPGLYVQLSHLRMDSVRVQVGQTVRRGDVLAACGSSGRSPEPHLHVQVQATPRIGSPTLAYPLAGFVGAAPGAAPRLRRYAVPRAGEVVSPPAPHRLLTQALRLAPGAGLAVRAAAPGTTAPTGPAQHWDAATDSANLAYLRCRTTGAVAYYEHDDTTFRFTAYYGDESAWLYLFYRAAYQVPLALLPPPVSTEETAVLPLIVVPNPLLRAAQDVVAPFWRFLRPEFSLRVDSAEAVPHARSLTVQSRLTLRVFGRPRPVQATELRFGNGALTELHIHRPGRAPLLLRCTAVA